MKNAAKNIFNKMKFLETNNSENRVNMIENKITFQDAWVAWENGEKFPVAFFGDSTYDGYNTTGWIGNSIGTDHEPPNVFTTYLQDLIRKHTNSKIARIYNAGFSGQIAQWGYKNIDAIFSGIYSDVKMVGIGFGINDRIGKVSTKDYKEKFRGDIENIIKWCYSKDIQPFLLTTQATIEPGTIDYNLYPYRTSENINSVANRVKKELAKKYGIDLIDLNYYTEKFLANNKLYKLKDIIPDNLHFIDSGHKFESEVIFAHFCPRVIMINNDKPLILDFSSQNIKSSIPSDKISYENNLLNLWYNNYNFKSYAYYDKGNKHNILAQDFIIFNMENDMNVYTVQINSGKDHETNLCLSDEKKPYVVINDKKLVLQDTFKQYYFEEALMYRLIKKYSLKFGLNTMQLYTGNNNKVSAVGFYIKKEVPNCSSKISFIQKLDGVESKNSVIPYSYKNYFNNNVLFKLKLDTNIEDYKDLIIPIFDTVNSGIFLNLKDTVLELCTYKREKLEIDNIEDYMEIASVDIGVSSKSIVETGIYIEISEMSIKVFMDIKEEPIIDYYTNGKILGSGTFANFVKVPEADGNDYAIVYIDVLCNL
ncbi:SGNH/GDSL hydrolase family protein [Clostridium sp. P21]|uniref:SGNH/GDSL hydrolase family protein n=1 Tax=Clostridium muellerianum TaxID=2716538 RepID=A0A7Y0EFD9_9CLOT|nr:SGNH/GDSL hydrolase family protein [Clostridium muellerianum]NMM62376.1 SGNH/GDSL hydrolase family protein [Clostridium muellerianum]